MPSYTRPEAREWAREKLIGAINCTIPSFTSDLRGINEKAIRHDIALAKQHGFIGTLGVSEVAISVPEYTDFLQIAKDEGGDDFVRTSTPRPSRRSTTTPRRCVTPPTSR